MAFAAGTQLGAYEIVGPLGAGGMGAVYLAHDSKLKRDVAIKVLPDEFAQDAERVARFQREAEVLASLNHPHIAAIYDLAEFDCSRFLVLELVEGETLADRIARGPILLDEALPMARQVAEALEAAHEKGIVHRDLKPENIKLTNDGNVKVLDFGLAKVREAEGAGTNLSNSPTMMTAGTPGMILGTPAYMSPEQAKGKEADRTADVWAFGCVLYAMLTGRAAFDGETVGEILGGVFKAEPDWHRLPSGTPEGIRRLLRRCLQKDRRLRFHDIADARIELEEVQSEPQTDARAVLSAPRRREQFAWSAFVLVTLVAVVVIVQALRPAPPTFEARLEIVTPPTGSPASFAISPDGRKVVFETSIEGRSSLSLRSLDSTSLRQLPGTDGASNPFWSPDSASVGFFAEGKLKRIDIDSGSLRMLASAPTGRGGTWSRSGVILFTPDVAGPVFRISASGDGEPVAVTRVDAPRQGNHRFPQFLPDGRHFLYYVIGTPEARGVYVGQLEGPALPRLLDADAAAVYASSGQLLFVRRGTLFAQGFDPVRLELSADSYRVAEQVIVDNANRAAISASAAGPIIYRSGSSGGQKQFVWFDRSGKEIGKVGNPDFWGNSSLSPDGSQVAMNRTVDGNMDVWLLELRRSLLRRFTLDPANDTGAIWSPDGGSIVFSSNRKARM